MRQAIEAYSARIGRDPSLVQGPGGNVSWKDGDVMWVKASGTWLERAVGSDIFVPVDLADIRKAIVAKRFDATPSVLFGSTLRPSIETMLHALLAHRVVVHVHAVEVLAHLVRPDFHDVLKVRLADLPDWVVTGYRKPGSDLARAVDLAISERPEANIIFLQSHGVVIGGDTIDAVERRLSEIVHRLKCDLRPTMVVSGPWRGGEVEGYRLVPEDSLSQLALDASLRRQVRESWALYPDHVVFLGAAPYVFDDIEGFRAFLTKHTIRPDVVFVGGIGVLERESLSNAKYAYLRCFLDVLLRQSEYQEFLLLSRSEITELIDWDAEKFRQSLDART